MLQCSIPASEWVGAGFAELGSKYMHQPQEPVGSLVRAETPTIDYYQISVSPRSGVGFFVSVWMIATHGYNDVRHHIVIQDVADSVAHATTMIEKAIVSSYRR